MDRAIRPAGRTLIALVADPEPIADRRAVLDVVLSASTEVQDQAAVALGARLNADDISINADVMDCLAAMGPRARASLTGDRAATRRRGSRSAHGAAVALASIDRRSTARVVRSPAQDRCRSLRARRMATNRPGKNYREVDETKVVMATPILIRQLASKTADVRENAIDMLRGIVSERPAELPDPAGAK